MNLILCDAGAPLLSVMKYGRTCDLVIRYSFGSSHTVDLVLQACSYCAEKGNKGKGNLDDWSNRNWLFEKETRV